MNTRFLSFALTAAILAGSCRAGESFFPLRSDLSGKRPDVILLRNDNQQVQFEIRIPGVDLLEGTLEGQKWDRVEIPGGGYEQDLGAPEVSHFTRLLVIPPTAGFRAEFEALETTIIPDVKLMPAQGRDPAEVAGRGLQVKFDMTAYARDEFYPETRVDIGEPAVMRGLRLVPLRTNPVQYNPVTRELKVATRYRVTVHFEGVDTRNVLIRRFPLSRSWAAALNGVAFNGLDVELDQTATGSYLIVCESNQELLSILQPLIDWKRRKGHEVAVSTFNPGFSSDQIKALIQTAYDTWDVPPEYVLLFGDSSGDYTLPTWGPYGIDHTYSQLDGADILSDVALGRLPAGNSLEAATMVQKVLYYEIMPYVANTDWYHQSVLVAWTSDNGNTVIHTARTIKALMQENGYTRIDTLWYTMGGSVPTVVSNAINNGVTYYNYSFWVGMGGFDNSDIDALTNGRMLPFCTLVGEATGGFGGGSPSPMEHFVEVGTPTTPKGAIGAIGGATFSQHSRYCNTLSIGFYTGIFDEGVTAAGHVLNRGKMELYNSYWQNDPTGTTNQFNFYMLAGDPGTDLYSGPIHFMTCDLPPNTIWGENSLTLTINEGGAGPVEGAVACVYMPYAVGHNLYQVSGVTDATGQVTLPLTVPITGNVKVTVSKHNFYPIVDSLNVIQEAVAVGYFSHTIDDDSLGTSSGDGDGIVNPGEMVEIPLQFKNYGNSLTATGIAVTASESDPFISLVDSQETFPDLPPGAIGGSYDDLDLAVSPDCPDGHTVLLSLTTTCVQGNWDGALPLLVKSWDIELLSAVASGGDTLLSPGETTDFVLVVRNLGHKDAASLSAVLHSLDPLVNVTDSLASFGTVAIDRLGSCGADPFTLSAVMNSPPGHPANLAVTYTANGAVHTDTITVILGSQSTIHPQGPDDYGYYCYDDTDLNYPQHPMYDWIEIDPAYGGSGTLLPISDPGEYQDSSVNAALPFTFRYYGEEVDSITVCSNGWISTRLNAGLANFENYPIPSASGPDGMIAPFWDDLITWSHGHIFSWFDEANHRFVIEWSRMKNRGSPGPQETFEIILFDPAYYPTPTGDGEIIFQYLQITEVIGDYESNPYSTVGIESPDQTDGIEVVYWNTYDDPNAAHLQAGRAYKFTTAFTYLSTGHEPGRVVDALWDPDCDPA